MVVPAQITLSHYFNLTAFFKSLNIYRGGGGGITLEIFTRKNIPPDVDFKSQRKRPQQSGQ